jgi:hypothetical protein
MPPANDATDSQQAAPDLVPMPPAIACGIAMVNGLGGKS